jgi:ADP-ribose pyrophosphatase YjhB (NUDIX family)
MGFEGSYLWRLRQRVGSEVVLMPGAMTVLRRGDGTVLLTRRVDDGTWCLPGGGAEEGSGFPETAATEVREEVGVEVDLADLKGFGCLSRADLHTIEYGNGDVTHCFAVLFLAERWRGEPRPDGEETSELDFFALDALPEPLHDPTATALGMLRSYLESGEFQAA